MSIARNLVLSAGLSLVGVACSPGESSPSFDTYSGTTPTSTFDMPDTTSFSPPINEATTSIADTPTSTTVVKAGEEIRQLLQQNAPLQLIFIPSTEADVLEGGSDILQQEKAASLAASDPEVLDEITEYFSTATDARYNPEISVTVLEPTSFFPDNCLPINREGYDNLDAYAAPYKQLGSIAVYVVDVRPCAEEGAGTGNAAGFAYPGEVPVITLYGSVMHGRTIAHETGHAANLGHATKLFCDDIEAAADCVTDPLEVGDEISLMGYFGGTTFTVPELDSLGLLLPSEILSNPIPGNYILGDTSQNGTEIKALRLDTNQGVLYFSWEADRDASHDVFCKPKDELTNSEKENLSSGGSKTNSDGTTTDYGCYYSTIRYQDHSLQVREVITDEAKDNGFTMYTFGLVLRPDRAPDGLLEELASGEVIGGRVLYEDDRQTVTFVGTTPDNRAIVEVSSN